MKKKILNLFYLFGIAILLSTAGCSNPSNSDSENKDSQSTLWSKSENGVTEKIKLTKTVEDGLTTTALSYTSVEESSGKGVGFGVVKIGTSNSPLYKGVIIARRKTEEFPHNFWTNYKIDCGQSTVSIANTIGGPDYEDEFFEYLIFGGLSASNINALKNANQLQIFLQNPDYPERYTTFVCNYEFIIQLIKRF
ncbi:MAG: hypothetical protein J6Z17_02885 [Treponema sp.]|nr:hypothetical protein [Treponema sp.]